MAGMFFFAHAPTARVLVKLTPQPGRHGDRARLADRIAGVDQDLAQLEAAIDRRQMHL